MPRTSGFGRHDIEAFIGDPLIFDRALDYYRRGLVADVAVGPSRIYGLVNGSQRSPYRVAVELVSGRFTALCTCPYPFRCKHVGALLLAALDLGRIPPEWHGSDLGEPERGWDEPDDEDDDLDEEELDDDWDEDDEWDPPNGRRVSGWSTPPAQSREPPPLGPRDLTTDKGLFANAGITDRGAFAQNTKPAGPEGARAPGSHVLELHILGESPLAGLRSTRIVATPMVRYIRKDGSLGSLSKWRPKVHCVTENPREIDLLPSFDSFEGRKLPLANLLPTLLLDKRPPALWVGPPSMGIPGADGATEPAAIGLCEIVRIEVSFFPVRYTHRGVLFCPYLVIVDESGERRALRAYLDERFADRLEEGRYHFLVEEQVDMLRSFLGPGRHRSPETSWYWVECEAGTALVVDRVRAVVFWSQSGAHLELLGHMDPEDLPEFSYADIVGIKNRFATRNRGAVEIALPPSKADIRAVTPKVVVEVGDASVTFFRDLVRPAEPSSDAGDVSNAAAAATDGQPLNGGGEAERPAADGQTGPRPGGGMPADLLVLDFYDNTLADDLLQDIARRCFSLLQPLNAVQDRPTGFFCDGSIEEIVAILADPMIEAGAYLRVQGRPARAGKLSFALRVVSVGEDWFGLRVTGDVDGEEVEIADGGGLAFTKDGHVVIVSNRDELEKLKKRLGITGRDVFRVHEGDFQQLADLDGLIADGDKAGGNERALRVTELIRRATERRDAWLRLAAKLDTLEKKAPAGFGTTLRPYQRHGYAWLEAASEEGFAPLLADDMGLGKTVQALALLQSRAAQESGPSLVVAPPTTLENWRHETLAFAPALTPVLYHGPDRKRLLAGAQAQGAPTEGEDDKTPAPTLFVTSYQTLLKDADALAEVTWNHVIFDEIQTIKNAKTKTYRAAKRLTGGHRLALSGTPVENTSLELYAVIDLLNPGLLGNRASFLRRLAGPIEREGDPEARRRLRELLTPIVLRRRKADVATDLPPRDEIPHYVTLPSFQRHIYESVRAYYQDKVSEALADPNPAKRLFVILEGLTRLRQAAVDPALLPLDTTGGTSPAGGSRSSRGEAAKLAALDELVPGIVDEGHRVLIFSQFVSLLSILRAWAERRSIPACYLDGSMTPAARRDEIDRFQGEAGPPIFFLSLRAGGVGVNLTAADYVVLMDPWWNPAVEDQAIERTHRIGQTRPLTAYRLIALNTVEEQIAALQARKKALAEDIIPDESSLISSLTPEEILAFFSPQR